MSERSKYILQSDASAWMPPPHFDSAAVAAVLHNGNKGERENISCHNEQFFAKKKVGKGEKFTTETFLFSHHHMSSVQSAVTH